MTHALRILLLLVAFATPALAERETHVVAIGTAPQINDFYALPEARVLVDRPGKEVSLILLDAGRIDWQIEPSDGTLVTEILHRSPPPHTSRVSLFGIRMTGINAPDLPLILTPVGRDFRAILNRLNARLGVSRIHSFQGAYQLPSDPIQVDRADQTRKGFAQDYLSGTTAPVDDLPPAIVDWMANDQPAASHTVVFDEQGVTLTLPNGTRHFPAPPDVPDILLPVAAVYDPSSRVIYALSYGGEGYIYAIDTGTGDWSVAARMEGYDAAALLYDPTQDVLITTGAFSRPGDIRVFDPNGLRLQRFLPTTDFLGLSDLFNYGNEHGPPLIPRLYSDGWLLVEAIARPNQTYPNTRATRLFAVRLDTKEVRLLRYIDD